MNRLRGAKHSTIGKFGAIAILCFIAFQSIGTNYLCFAFLAVAYLLGEAMGWGKWIATLIEREPRYDEDEGLTILFDGKVRIWDGIHHLASLFISEFDDYLNYSRLALAIRGVYWWGPVYLILYYFGVADLTTAIVSTLILGVCFPLSVEVARYLDLKNIGLFMRKGLTWSESDWAYAELFYGALQGAVLVFI